MMPSWLELRVEPASGKGPSGMKASGIVNGRPQMKEVEPK